MTDEQIIEICKRKVKKYGSVSVAFTLSKISNLQVTETLRRRIHNKLLEDNQYIEYTEKGRKRIRLNPIYEPKQWHEKHWLLYELIKAVLIGAATLGAGVLLKIIPQQPKEQQTQGTIQRNTVDSNSRR